jgi:beta-N-acetylhexosaminidase
MNELTTDQKLAQLFIFDSRDLAFCPTPALSPFQEHFIRNVCPGGLIFFRECIRDRRQLASWLKGWKQCIEDRGLPGEFIVCADQRGGDHSMLMARHGGLEYPAPMAQASISCDPWEMGRELGAMVARDSLDVGMNLILAPYSDFVEETGFNEAHFGNSMYGSNIETNTRIAEGLIRGFHQEGLRSTYCTFPGGYGSVDGDPHMQVLQVNRGRAYIDERVLRAPKAAIAQDVDAIMLSHHGFPDLDSSGRPATISDTIIQGLLREELGFRGAIMTDSMRMRGVTSYVGTPQAAVVKALQAGADLILCASLEMYQAACDAVREGRLSEKRIDEAYGHVLALKRKLAPHPATTRTEPIPEDAATAHAWVERSITWLRRPEYWRPFQEQEPVLVSANWPALLDASLMTGGNMVKTIPWKEDHEYNHYRDAPAEYEDMIAASILGESRPGQKVVLGTNTIASLRIASKVQAEDRNVSMVHAGKLHPAMKAPDNLDTILLNYSHQPAAAEKAVSVLWGKIEAEGLLPVPS